MTLDQTPRVSAKVAEFVDLYARLKAEDSFDMRQGMAIALEQPKTEQLVIETGKLA